MRSSKMDLGHDPETEHRPHRHNLAAAAANDDDEDDDVAEQHVNPMAARGMRKSGTMKHVRLLQNTFSGRACCIAQIRPGSLFLRSAVQFHERMTEWVKQRNMSHRKKSQIMVRQPGGVSGEDGLVVPAHHKHSDLEEFHAWQKEEAAYEKGQNPAAGAAEAAGWKQLTDNSSGAPRTYCPSRFCRTPF